MLVTTMDENILPRIKTVVWSVISVVDGIVIFPEVEVRIKGQIIEVLHVISALLSRIVNNVSKRDSGCQIIIKGNKFGGKI